MKAALSTWSLVSSLCFLLAVACQKDDAVSPGASAAATTTTATTNGLGALPLTVTAPADNASMAAKINLGQALFWDPILSGSRDVSCASCHHPASGYADQLDLPIGVNGQGLGATRRFHAPNDIPFGKRNTQTLLNVAFNGIGVDAVCNPVTAPMFWDERAQSLEAQSLLPIATLEEMRGHQFSEAAALDSVVSRLRRIPQYQQQFAAVFGGAAPITATNLGKALACFERTLVATDTPFDRYMRGDQTALTTQQVQGLNAFVQSGCQKCHSGPMLSDYQLHVLGVADNGKLTTSDSGQNGTYAFRTPSLRNLAATAPYMHSGVLTTLADVLRFYDAGRGTPTSANPHVPRNSLDALFPRTVTNQQAIIAFLGSLNSDTYDKRVPAQVPSGLPVGGNIQ
ncbi:cytochrome-c peroxidase [Hymenobacter sp. GOD-10R]|uniref:cytochrome-c peroxidase n=1 Tax=Hymenobacter sp. GOD-10R TaxID=3093922 RepID=UPI002D76A26E|nr:cytochrome-c peroxidase [Hymenobacter sp. GOD-10R]WRQ29259.1 cytochrome-c peroxidase [Hymenobacter sp. GOD-10R]